MPCPVPPVVLPVVVMLRRRAVVTAKMPSCTARYVAAVNRSRTRCCDAQGAVPLFA